MTAAELAPVTPTITFKNATLAQAWCNLAIRGNTGFFRGSGFWEPERWIREANRHAEKFGVEYSAQKLASLKSATSKKVTITGCRCERCGAPLTAPESVAAGIGPECMAND